MGRHGQLHENDQARKTSSSWARACKQRNALNPNPSLQVTAPEVNNAGTLAGEHGHDDRARPSGEELPSGVDRVIEVGRDNQDRLHTCARSNVSQRFRNS